MMLSWLSNRLYAYGQYRIVKNELSRLNDRELSDIGINRCDIDHIAHSVFDKHVNKLSTV